MRVTVFNYVAALYVFPLALDCYTLNPVWTFISRVELWSAIAYSVLSLIAYVAYAMATKKKEGVITRIGKAIYYYAGPFAELVRFSLFWRIVFITLMTCVCVNHLWNYSLVAFLVLSLWKCWPRVDD